jgi:hypothetical protein
MTHTNDKNRLALIQNELQQIIINGIGDNDLHSIPDDIPILDLGIGSLALVEGLRQVYDHFGVLVSIRRVIEGQITIGTLALYIEQELYFQKSPKKKTGSTQWKIERQIPLAPSQQHLGFLSRYSKEAGAAFHEALILHLDGALHGPALHAAVEEVGNRYEALCTALNPENNTLEIGTGETLELTVSPITAGQLHQQLVSIVARPFEIGKRLFRAELLRISETEHVMVLVGHLLVIEQKALKVILNDIATLYYEYSHDQEASSASLTIQWPDYLALSKTSERITAHQLAKSFWKEYFSSGIPSLELPLDFVRPAIKNYAGSRVSVQLTPALSERLNHYAVSEGFSPETVLLAAISIFLHRVADLNDLIIGI